MDVRRRPGPFGPRFHPSFLTGWIREVQGVPEPHVGFAAPLVAALRRAGGRSDDGRGHRARGAGSGGRRRRRHPEDPARHRDHAGEPLFRQLLRDLPGCGRDSDEERSPNGVQPRSQSCTSASSPTSTTTTTTAARRTAHVGVEQDVNGGKMDGFIRAHRATHCDEPRTRFVRRVFRRRHGIPHPARHPELLGVREGVRAPGSHVRTDRVMEPAGSPLHGVGMVGALRRPTTRQLRGTTSERSRSGVRPTSHIFAWTDLTICCTSTASRGATTSSRAPRPTAKTRQRCRARPNTSRRGHSASGTRCPPSTPFRKTASSATSSRSRASTKRQGGDAAGRLVDRAVVCRERARACGRRAGPVVRDEPRQHGDAQSRMGLDGDLPRLGRLGRVLRPRGAAHCRRAGLRHSRARDR